MKTTSILMSLILAGCGGTIGQQDIAKMQEHCSNKEGVFEFYVSPAYARTSVTCKNGKRYSLDRSKQ